MIPKDFLEFLKNSKIFFGFLLFFAFFADFSSFFA